MKKNKGFIHLLPLLIIGLVFAVIGVSVFRQWYWNTYQKEPIEIVEQKDAEYQNNWKMYSGNGFEFNYPASSSVKETSDEYQNIFLTVMTNGNPCIDVSIESLQNNDQQDYIDHYDLQIGETKSYEFPEAFSQIEEFTYTETWSRLEDKNIGDKNWHTLKVDNNYENHGIPINYLFMDNNFVWNIEITSSDAFCDQTKVTQILESFAFTNTTNYCGGIAGFACDEGYVCNMTENYPDAMGTCIEQ